MEVPDDPSRIVCLGPGCLRLIAFLEATNRVVGIERFEIAQKTGRPYRLAHPELLALPEGTYRKLHDMQQQLHAQFAV